MIDRIEITSEGNVQVRHLINGVYHREILTPMDTIKATSLGINEITDKVWTSQKRSEWRSKYERP